MIRPGTLSITLLVAGIALAIVSCKDSTPTGPQGSPSTVQFPDSNVSYGQHVQPLFNQACAFSGCHDAAVASDRVKLTSWGSVVVEMPGIVVAGQPSQSTLVWRIDGSVGQRMPLGMNPLNQNQINGIKKWILEGARNN
jgi:hypothetical protein